jgi:hypothetical protein
MSLKRSCSNNLLNSKKKLKQGALVPPTASITSSLNNESELLKVVPNNTNEAINHLLSLFPSNQQLNVPSIIYLHQLYNFTNLNRTQIDRDIIQLKLENKIKVFKFDAKSDQICICYTETLVNYFKSLSNLNDIVTIVIDKFYKGTTEASIKKDELLHKCKLTDSTITKLIQNVNLKIKDEKEYWHSIPNIGLFIKLIQEGRKLITFLLSKKKYREISMNEIKDRNLKKLRLLGILYHFYDLIGSDIVDRVDSPLGGLVIRLNRGE